MTEEIKTFKDLVREDDKIKKIVSPAMADFMFENNKFTVSKLNKTWVDNLNKNMKLYKKHGSVFDGIGGFGTNKAVIGVGAGPSFHNNKDVLKKIYQDNLLFSIDNQPFIIIATNKMFKPLVKMGIYPHFVVLVDAGEALYDQLCTDIPIIARQSILIAGLHTSNKILKKWDKNGGKILFYLIGSGEEKKIFKRKTLKDPDRHHIQQGGNILNTIWIISQRVLGSSIYMTVGNDLAYEYSKDREKREKSFYADGDYSFNKLNKRDEAKENLAWMGFRFHKSPIIGGDSINMELMSTSRQMWVYKTFMEVQVALWADQKPFHFYNCSESGILGMLSRGGDKKDDNNWFLIDELYPKRWHTMKLEDAANEFLRAKAWQEATRTGVRCVAS